LLPIGPLFIRLKLISVFLLFHPYYKVAMGMDGITLCLPPDEGFDQERMAAAKARAEEAARKASAPQAKTAKAASMFERVQGMFDQAQSGIDSAKDGADAVGLS
jgi:hypothetical protein